MNTVRRSAGLAAKAMSMCVRLLLFQAVWAINACRMMYGVL